MGPFWCAMYAESLQVLLKVSLLPQARPFGPGAVGAVARETLGTSPGRVPPEPSPGGRRGRRRGEGQAPPHWPGKRNGPLAMVQPTPGRTPPKVSRTPLSAEE